MGPRNRPSSVLVLGILQIIFGSLGLLGSLCGVATQLAGGSMFGGQTPQGMPDIQALLRERVPHYEAMLLGGLILGLFSGTVMIVSGVGLIGMRPWARVLTIGYAVYYIASTILNVVYAYLVSLPVMKQLFEELRADPKLPAQAVPILSWTESIATLAPIIQLVLLGYPALLLMILLSPGARAAFRGQSAKDGEERLGGEDWEDERDAPDEEDLDDRPDDGIQGGGQFRDR